MAAVPLAGSGCRRRSSARSRRRSAPARTTLGSSRRRTIDGHRTRAVGSSASASAITGHRSTRPGMSGQNGDVALIRRNPSSSRPSKRGVDQHRRIGARTSGRNARAAGSAAACRPPPAARRNRAASGRIRAGPRPGRNRSTASCRRRRRSCARHPAARPRRGEFLRQPVDHLPLRRAGVLRLVHQDVVDPAVEPEQHPARHAGSVSKSRGAQDQVVEIQPAAQLLGARHRRAGRPARSGAAPASAARAAGATRVGAGVLDPLHHMPRAGPSAVAQRRARGLGRKRADLGGKGRPWRPARSETRPPASAARRSPATAMRRQLGRGLGIGRAARRTARAPIGAEAPSSPPRNTVCLRCLRAVTSGGRPNSARPARLGPRRVGKRRALPAISRGQLVQRLARDDAAPARRARGVAARRRAPRRSRRAAALAARSSISANCGLTPASSGNRRSSEAQKEWIVWIFSPPGVSMARANRRARVAQPVSRQRRPRRPDRAAPRAARRRPASPSRPAAGTAGSASRSRRPWCRSGTGCAAASTPSSSSRATRSVSTRVLPDPALAASQVEGRAAPPATWRTVASSRGSCQHPPAGRIVGDVPFAKAREVVVVAGLVLGCDRPPRGIALFGCRYRRDQLVQALPDLSGRLVLQRRWHLAGCAEADIDGVAPPRAGSSSPNPPRSAIAASSSKLLVEMRPAPSCVGGVPVL